MASTLETFIRRVFQRVRAKPWEDSGACHICNIFRSPVIRSSNQDLFSKVKDKLLHLVPPTIKKETFQVNLFKFLSQHILHPEILLWLMYQVIWKAANFEWVPEQRRTLQPAQDAMWAILLLGPYDLTDPMVLLEISVVGKDTMWSLWQTPMRAPRLWSKTMPSAVKDYMPLNNKF